MPPQFLYFDLGNVLLSFSHEKACEQLADVSGAALYDITRLLMGADGQQGLLWRLENGEIDEAEFYATFCKQLSVAPERAAFDLAAADMFEPIDASVALLGLLYAAGHRLGVLSNTNSIHWRHVMSGRFPFLGELFEHYVTSFEAGSMKPDPVIYRQALARVTLPAGQVFFVDDRAENVAGALAEGMDAVAYVDHSTLVADLQARGIEW